MKGLKKYLAVLLALAMIVASVMAVPVFAAEGDEDEEPLSNGAILEKLGLLLGTGDGVDETYLAKTSTRMQMAILYARWIGIEAEAFAFSGWTDNFSDYDDRTSVVAGANEQNMLAYYKANPDYGFIGTNSITFTFEPQASATNKQLAKILLTALGYPYGAQYNWNDILTFAYDKIGTSFGSTEQVIYNSDIADYLAAALIAKTADDEYFYDDLIAKGVITQEALDEVKEQLPWPSEAEVPDETPSELEIVEWRALNFQEVEIEFNQAIDPDSIKKDLFVVEGSKLGSNDRVYVVPDSDDKVIRIYMAGGFADGDEQGAVRSISFSGVKSAKGAELAASSQSLTFRDSTSPAVEKVVAKGNSRLDIYFTEAVHNASGTPLTSKSTYKISGKSLVSNTPEFNSTDDSNTSRVVTIKKINMGLAAGSYTLSIEGKNIADLAGNSLGYREAEFTIEEDTEGPVAQGVVDPIYPNKVKIEFNEEIQDDASIYWLSGSSKRVSNTTSVDDNIATFEFSGSNNIMKANTSYTIYLQNAKDYSGNAAGEPLSFTIMPIADTTLPEVTGYGSDGEGSFWVRFSKDINKSKKGTWKIKNSDDDTVSSSSYTLGIDSGDDKDDADLITVHGAGLNSSGKYTVTIKNTEDTAKPDANKLAEVTFEVEIPDTIGPSITSGNIYWGGVNSAGNYNTIYVYFNEEVDITTANTRSNYQWSRSWQSSGSYQNLPTTTKVELMAGDRLVRLTLADDYAVSPADAIVAASADAKVYLKVANVTDYVGNVGDTVVLPVHAYKSGAHVMAGTTAATWGVRATSKTKIELTFDATPLATYDPSEFTLVDQNNKTLDVYVSSASYSTSDSVLSLTLSDSLTANAQYGGSDVYVKYSTDSSSIYYTSTTEDTDAKSKGWKVYDSIAPTWLATFFNTSSDYEVVASTSGNAVILVFDEPVKPHHEKTWADTIQLVVDGKVKPATDANYAWVETLYSLTDDNGAYYALALYFTQPYNQTDDLSAEIRYNYDPVIVDNGVYVKELNSPEDAVRKFEIPYVDKLNDRIDD
jgi:hypothetical protein